MEARRHLLRGGRGVAMVAGLCCGYGSCPDLAGQHPGTSSALLAVRVVGTRRVLRWCAVCGRRGHASEETLRASARWAGS
jgi:hypothetical protein